MPVSTADLADSEGPNASVPFGEANQISSLQRSSGALALGGSQQQPQGQPPAPGGGPAGAPQGPQPASQPQPQEPPFRFDQKNYPLQQRSAPPAPWRERLHVWGNHPEAGLGLKRLAWMANPKNMTGG